MQIEKMHDQTTEPPKENVRSGPLEFIIVGSGQVVDKYWMPADRDKLVFIKGIVSLEKEEAFRSRNNNFAGEFASASDPSQIVDLLEKLVKMNPNVHIALAVPADVRLALTKEILTSDSIPPTSKIFLEKPFARTEEEIAVYRELVLLHSDRLHFSGKYANGRADILMKHLPQGRVPNRITARLIEGSDYFNVVKQRLMKVGTHPYIIDGPELDLGYHLADIIATATTKFGEVDSFEVISVNDAQQTFDGFEPGFGFTAELILHTKSGNGVPLSLVAGKRNGPNDRFIEFIYGNTRYRQQYTVAHATDPVEVNIGTSSDRYIIVEEHPAGYNYYARELQKEVFGSQSQEQQLQSLYITDLLIRIRSMRLSQSLH